MKNFDTNVGDTSAILDEIPDELEDQDTDFLFDETVVTENVWGSEELTAGVFIHLGFSTDMYCSTFDIDMYYGNTKYTATPFEVSNLDFGSDLSVDQCDISISNIGLAFSAILLNNDEIGSSLTLSAGAIASTRRIYELEPIFVGELVGWSINEENAVLNYAGLMARWNKKTLRLAQNTCPWPLGGTECGYEGSGQCDQQFVNCKYLGNHLNFGGFLYLSELMEKKIYWGSYPPS